jgi:hypothetical protein
MGLKISLQLVVTPLLLPWARVTFMEFPAYSSSPQLSLKSDFSLKDPQGMSPRAPNFSDMTELGKGQSVTHRIREEPAEREPFGTLTKHSRPQLYVANSS